jgi:uncharacterized membrane protein YfcA
VPTLFESAVTAVTLLVGATVLSTIGFGIGMTTIPILLFVLEPQTVIVVVNTVSVALFILIVHQNRDELPFRRVGPWAAAGLLGVPVGVLILKDSDAGLLKIAITSVTIVLTLVVAFNVRAMIPSGLLVGLVVAFVVSVTLNALGIGGPIMALYMLTQNWSRNAVRGALSLYFLFVEAAGVVGYGIAGLLTTERIALILIAVVPVTLGFLLATYLVKRMNDVVFRRATVVAIIGMSGLVLAREIAALVD